MGLEWDGPSRVIKHGLLENAPFHDKPRFNILEIEYGLWMCSTCSELSLVCVFFSKKRTCSIYSKMTVIFTPKSKDISCICVQKMSTYISRKQLLVCLLVCHGDTGIYKQAFYVNIIG